MKDSELRLAMLISGGGTTMNSVLEACEREELVGVRPVVVISSDPSARGIIKARNHNIPTFVVSRKGVSRELFGEQLLSVLRDFQVDIVSQNGWLPLTPANVVSEYQTNNMIINQHPGPLDPGRGNDFGGKGMHGSAVMCARIAYLWMSSDRPCTESTVHAVTNNLDEGDLISIVEMNLKIPDYVIDLMDLDKPRHQQMLRFLTQEAQDELLPLEHSNVIAALSKFGSGNATTFRRQEALVPEEKLEVLEAAKKIAVDLYPNG